MLKDILSKLLTSMSNLVSYLSFKKHEQHVNKLITILSAEIRIYQYSANQTSMAEWIEICSLYFQQVISLITKEG